MMKDGKLETAATTIGLNSAQCNDLHKQILGLAELQLEILLQYTFVQCEVETVKWVWRPRYTLTRGN